MINRLLRQARDRLVRQDYVLLACTLILLAVGCVFLYGVGRHIYVPGRTAGVTAFSRYWLRQVQWAVLGAACMTAAAVVDYRRLARWQPLLLLYLAVCGLLTLVLVAGREINGARSWLPIAGFTLQPSEAAKPVVLLIAARLLSLPDWRLKPLWRTLAVGGMSGLVVFLICLQPDWGTAMVFLPMLGVMWFVAGGRILVAALAVAAAVAAAPVVYEHLLSSHQRQRIQIFLHPEKDPQNAGWNARQTLLAVGSGWLHGKGWMRGTQYTLGFLPRKVTPTDFIFSVIAEETGFVGGCVMIFVYGVLLFCCVRTAFLAPDRLGALLCIGAASLIFTHVYINIGMNIRAAPIVGIPLPLVSYGGSFVVGVMTTLGLVQSVHIAATEPGAERSVEMERAAFRIHRRTGGRRPVVFPSPTIK